MNRRFHPHFKTLVKGLTLGPNGNSSAYCGIQTNNLYLWFESQTTDTDCIFAV